MTVDGPLTPAMARAVAAVLTTETHAEAATVANVSERSLRRWLNLPSFRTELARQRTRVLDGAITVLVRGSTRAAEALVEMAVTDTKATPTKVAAARAVLDLALRATELGDVIARIETLEAEAAGRRVVRGQVR
jgi:hypothetical protein